MILKQESMRMSITLAELGTFQQTGFADYPSTVVRRTTEGLQDLLRRLDKSFEGIPWLEKFQFQNSQLIPRCRCWCTPIQYQQICQRNLKI